MKKKSQEAIIILREIAPHQWIFEFPRIGSREMGTFHDAIDVMEFEPVESIPLFMKLSKRFPEFLDARHHLALALQEAGEHGAALMIWRSTTELALAAFPEHFSMRNDRVFWGFHENRPFLRLCMGFGMALLRKGDVEGALGAFTSLLSLNPNDNQGARSAAARCYFCLGRPEGLLDLCKLYPNDATEDLVYGKPLALFQLGRTKEADIALQEAIECYPRIALELLKKAHRRPSNFSENSITMGGQDQAYLYWKDSGKFWKETPGAEEFLRRHTLP